MHYAELHRRLKVLEGKVSDDRPTNTRLETVARSGPPVQAYGLSRFTSGKDLPVVVAVGINYTQGPMPCPRRSLGAIEVEDDLRRCRGFLKKAFRAYEERKREWAEKQKASSDMLKPPDEDEFHLVMTNFCLWITNERWLLLGLDEQKLLLENNPLYDGNPTCGPNWLHLDQLARTLEDQPVLWVSHGLNTKSYAPPHVLFRDFSATRSMDWIMTPNLSYPYRSYGVRFP